MKKKRKYINCSECGERIYEGDDCYMHNDWSTEIFCSEMCLSVNHSYTLDDDMVDEWEYEEVEEDIDAYNDDVKLGII